MTTRLFDGTAVQNVKYGSGVLVTAGIGSPRLGLPSEQG
jgi:hypothetical protein